MTQRRKNILGIIPAGLAALALMALSPCNGMEPSPTKWMAGITEDGTLIIEGPIYDYYASTDGGITWEYTERYDQLSNITWGGREEETPHGTYKIQGTEITRETPGSTPTTAYTLKYMQQDSNKWAQRLSIRKHHFTLGSRQDRQDKLMVYEPRNMIHDPSTGNIILTMETQGALVGTPEQEWKRVGVNRFIPTDFSLKNKARRMFTAHFWLTSLSVTIACLAIGLTWSQTDKNNPSERRLLLRKVSKITAGATALFVIASLIAALRSTFPPEILFYAWLVSIPVAAIVCLIAIWTFALCWPRKSPARMAITMAFAGASLLMSIYIFPPFQGSRETLLIMLMKDIITTGGLLFAILAITLNIPSRRQIRTIGTTAAAMIAAITLPFTIWLTGEAPTWLATTTTLTILGTATFITKHHLTKQTKEVRQQTE